MKKMMFMIAALAGISIVSITSCQKESVIKGTSYLKNNASDYGTFDLASLSKLAVFAHALDQSKSETRSFSIKLKDATLLTFELNSAPASKLFGKARLLGGTVTVNGQRGIAVMVIGENGFDIIYQYGNHSYRIKPKFSLDIGYANCLSKIGNTDLEKTINTIKQKYPNQDKETIEQKVLEAAGKRQTEDKDLKFNSVSESGINYELIDLVETSNNRTRAEGQSVCSEVASTTTGKQGNQVLGSTNGIYNLLIAYKSPDFDLPGSYLKLLMSLWVLGGSSPYIREITVTEYQPNFFFPDGTVNMSEVVDYYMSLVFPTGTPEDQLHLLEYYASYSHGINPNNYVVVNLQEDGWGSVLGRAYINAYPVFPYSCLIATDDHLGVLAHECGHNLGAIHDENNTNDLMYPTAGGNREYHYNTANINTIKSKMGW